MGSSFLTLNWSRVSCIGVQSFSHWITREVPLRTFLKKHLLLTLETIYRLKWSLSLLWGKKNNRTETRAGSHIWYLGFIASVFFVVFFFKFGGECGRQEQNWELILVIGRWKGGCGECISISSKCLVRLQMLNDVVHVTPTSLVCVPPFSGPSPFSWF